MLIERSQVACEIEAVEGTAETLEAADAFLAFAASFSPAQEVKERNPGTSSLSPHPGVPGKRSATMSFDVELGGTGNAGDPLPFADALKACGVQETLVANTSATYAPASDSVPSVTIALYDDGKIYKMWGARGKFTIDFVDGEPAVIHFEFTGADWSEADGNLLAGVSYNTTLPPAFIGAQLTIDAYSAIIEKLTLDSGNNVTLRPDANASSGHKSAVITSRRPTITLDPENVLVATHDFLGKWRSGTQMALSTTLGSAAGNTIAVTMPKIQYQEAGLGDRSGISIFELTGLCCQNSGDDEWQIQIT